MTVTIIQNHNDCIGCGACAAIAPNDWKLDGDKAILVDGDCNGEKVCSKTADDVGANQDAANACPVKCIIIEEA
ncbi:MAG: ferredoxin [Candidatus Diapherotrites archaeon]|jgi:ferredoxin|uniref:Ferredoxin n=1 Tax=Candidatus Iainarchaeum sp. TaxID=3101447 RepID=A0A8T5GFG1_9ARCH|nr:ferredoxin [Candidatus Diapherotrites archaeon]